LSLIADEYLGVPITCGSCKRSFWVRSPLADSPAGPAGIITATARFEVGGATSAGRVRTRNEDSYLAQLLAWSGHDRRGETARAVVAAGLGGHEAGEEASDMVVRTAGAALLPLLAGEATGGDRLAPQAVADAIESVLQEANQQIHARAKQESRGKGM